MEGLPDPGQIWSDFTSNPVVQLAATLIVIYVVMLWLGTAYWPSATARRPRIHPALLASHDHLFPAVFLSRAMYSIIRPARMAEVSALAGRIPAAEM